MKHIKKVVTLMLAFAMVLAMSATSFAVDTETKKDNGNFNVTITGVDSAETHAFTAYQVFKGDLLEKEDGKLILSNIEWGDGVNGTALLAAARAASDAESGPLKGKFPATVTDAASFAKALDKVANDSDVAQAVAELISKNLTTTTSGTGGKAGVTGLKAGYYFIQDEGTFTSDEAGAYTRYILQVVHNVEIATKASVPTVDKDVQDKNDTTGETAWSNTADYDIGDEVPFRIVGTLPSTFADYDHFKTYTITDTLSAGLTAPDADDIKVMVPAGGRNVTSHFDINVDGQTITISLKEGEDLKTWTSPALTSTDSFVVTYSAVLNNEAAKGTAGNKNEATLTFSNNPNADGDGSYDTTPPSTVVVFTYDFIVNKTDEDSQPLDGANFALYKKYQTTPEDKTAVTTVNYDEGRQTYTFEGANWVLVEEITSGNSFAFEGIDEGDYVLVETKTPAGYNSIAPVAFTVTPSLDDSNKLITSINGKTNGETVNLGTLEATVGLSNTESSLTTTVVNQTGTQLPSTGGIGTVIFYVLGSLLVVGCGIVLISKRRMKSTK